MKGRAPSQLSGVQARHCRDNSQQAEADGGFSVLRFGLVSFGCLLPPARLTVQCSALRCGAVRRTAVQSVVGSRSVQVVIIVHVVTRMDPDSRR